MPATSSGPGSQPESVAVRNQATQARQAIKTATRIGRTTTAAVTAASQGVRIAQRVASASQASTPAQARRILSGPSPAQKQARQEAHARAKVVRQQIAKKPQVVEQELKTQTTRLAKRIESHTDVKLARPKVELGSETKGHNNKLTVDPKLATKLIANPTHNAKEKLVKALVRLPARQNLTPTEKAAVQATRKPPKAAQAKKQTQRAIQSIPDIGNSRAVAPFVAKQARKHGLEPSVLMSQIEHESAFNPAATSSAGAQGETQFMPGTAPSYGVKFGTSPKAVKSQIKGQAKFMGELVQSKGNISDALAAYNAGPAAPPSAAGTYPQDILRDAAKYAALDKVKGDSRPVPKQTVTRFEAIVDEAKKIDSAHLTYSLGAGHVSGKVPGPSKTQYDCSSAVSRVLQAAGYDTGGGAQVSGYYENFGKPGPGAVTIYANAEHVFMKIGNRYWGTSHANPGGGPGFIPTSYEEGEATSGKYVVRHVPGLGQDIARRMGIRLSGQSATPGMSVSGNTATITDGVIRDTPGSSTRPIKLDPRTVRRKAKRQDAKARQKVLRELIAQGPQTTAQTTSTSTQPEDAYTSYARRAASTL